jgi:hypothetical protein
VFWRLVKKAAEDAEVVAEKSVGRPKANNSTGDKFMKNIIKDKKSLLNFGVLIVVGVLVAFYLLGEANKAVAELGALALR